MKIVYLGFRMNKRSLETQPDTVQKQCFDMRNRHCSSLNKILCTLTLNIQISLSFKYEAPGGDGMGILRKVTVQIVHVIEAQHVRRDNPPPHLDHSCRRYVTILISLTAHGSVAA